MTMRCSLCREALTAMMKTAVLQCLLLCLLLPAGPRIAAARSLLEVTPTELSAAHALLQAKQCTCTCPSPMTGSAPAPAPQTPMPVPELGSPATQAPGPGLGDSTVPALNPETGSPGPSAPASVPGSSPSEAPSPSTAGRVHNQAVLEATG